jgi:hypothetical protein
MIYNEVFNLINSIYLNEHKIYINDIIKYICNDLKLSNNDIQFYLNKYNNIFFYSLTDYINNLKNNKKRNRKLPNDCDRCIALISDKSRCKLAKIKGKSYCGRHSKTIKYGNINNIYNSINYIIVKKILIDNTTFLIDKNNNMYSYENPPKLIGKHTKSI